MSNEKCKLLTNFTTLFGEIPSIEDYNIFINGNLEDVNNLIDKKIMDLINNIYQEKLLRSPTDYEYRNFRKLFKNSKINKYKFIESIQQSNEYKSLQSINNNSLRLGYTKKVSYNNLNSFVDKIYIINLERRIDRFKKISAKLCKFKIEFERFNAVDGTNISIRDEWIQCLEKGSKITSPGAYGCLLSHLQIIKSAKQNNYKNILIFEDDILFHKNFIKEISKLSYIPNDYALIYLGASQFKNISNISAVNKNYYKANETYGTFAYIIRDTVYDVLIDVLEKKQFDIDFSLCIIQKLHNCYVLWENVIIADLSSSDIRIEKRSYDNVGWDIHKYDFEADFNLDVLPTQYKKYIGYKIVNTIDDAIIDIEYTKNMQLTPGFSFLIRAKNEELLVEACLESIVSIADEIIFVDNGSSDLTLEKAKNFADKYNNIFVYQYNINVPKVGSMHEKAVESGSLNTLGEYYNWCLSKVTRYNVIKWDCDFIAIKQNLIKMINIYDLKTRSDKFGIWFTGKTLFFGKYLRENDYYDEFRVFSKKNGFYWNNYKGCETSAYYVWSLDRAYINGYSQMFSDIRFKNLDKFKKESPPLFYEIKTKSDIKLLDSVLDTRDKKDNDVLIQLQFTDADILYHLISINHKNYKLLITVPSLTVGGGNLWTINIYKALIELGFDVKIYCNYVSKNFSENVYIDYFDQNDVIFGLSADIIYEYILDNNISYIIQTTPLLTDEHLRKLKDKVFVSVLTHSDVSYINNYIYNNNNLFNKIITVNSKTINKFANYGITHTAYIPNYITDIDFKKDKQTTKKMGIISRLSTDKNIIMTLHAFNQFIESDIYSDYELHIVGDDSEKIMSEIKYYVEKLNITNNVILHGYQKNVMDYYYAFDIIILPSVSEGCPYNLLEAALAGTPIICSDVGGNKEIVRDHAVLFELEGAESTSDSTIYINSYDNHLDNIGYKIVNKDDGIQVPDTLKNFSVIPSIDCINGNEKLSNKITTWNRNIDNMVNAFIKMINNYDHYKQDSEILYNNVKNRYSSKKVYMNHIIKILDLDFEFI